MRKNPVQSNAKIAIVFFVLIGFFALLSFLIKGIIVFRQSAYNNNGRFIINISNAGKSEVLSLSSSLKEATVFRFPNKIEAGKAGRLLKVPIDGYISLDSFDFDKKIDSIFFDSIFALNKVKTSLTIKDLVNLFFLVRTIPESSLRIIEIKNYDGVGTLVGRLARDPLIEKEHQTIQVINATEVSGLGAGLTELLTNLGCNVIMVTTADKASKKSEILYIDEKTYVVRRLEKILGYETKRKTENAIADITIIIGEDKLDELIF